MTAAALAGRAGPSQGRRCHATNIALDYHGDSVINSVMDIGAMIAGFRLACLRPVGPTAVAALLMEAVVGCWMRDNPILNIIMPIHPSGPIGPWRAGSTG
jgi:hypothetical protein